MRGDLLLLLLLVSPLATSAAQTDKKLGAEHAGAAKTQVKAEAVKGQKAQPKAKPAQEKTAEAQAETKKQPVLAEAAQVKTEAGQTQEAQAQNEEPQAQTDQDPKLTSVPGGKALGMSILGNQEAPTSLVIVPWKSSEVGRATGISPMLDDSRQPVDKEVFMRELRYYEIRSEKKP
jgi:NADH dehydrogenase/NADH:ubiquinone oxidoreductase subunit G